MQRGLIYLRRPYETNHLAACSGWSLLGGTRRPNKALWKPNAGPRKCILTILFFLVGPGVSLVCSRRALALAVCFFVSRIHAVCVYSPVLRTYFLRLVRGLHKDE